MLNYVNLRKAKKEERQAAAALIQFCWRAHRSTAVMMMQEQEEKKQARVLDRQEQKVSVPIDDDEDADLTSFDSAAHPPNHGRRENVVASRFRKLWKVAERSYKVGFEARLHNFRHAHRDRMELEPEKVKDDKERFPPQLVTTIENMVQQTMRETLTANELSQVLAATVESTVSKALKSRAAPLQAREQKEKS